MFNKRLIYFAGPEANEQEKTSADLAKERMAGLMQDQQQDAVQLQTGGKAEEKGPQLTGGPSEMEKKNSTMEEEANNPEKSARLDIKGIYEQGTEIVGYRLPGFEKNAAFVRQQLDATKADMLAKLKAVNDTNTANKLPQEDGHFTINFGLQLVTPTADGKEAEAKTYYVAALIDASSKPSKVRFFYKEGSDFVPNKKEKVDDYYMRDKELADLKKNMEEEAKKKAA